MSSLTNPVHFVTFSSPRSFSPFWSPWKWAAQISCWEDPHSLMDLDGAPWRPHHLWLHIFLHDPSIQLLSTAGVLIWAHACEKGTHLMGNFGLRTCHQPGQNFLGMCCCLRLYIILLLPLPHIWPTLQSEASPCLLLLSTLSLTGICSNPDLGSTSQQVSLNIFLFILIFFSLFHLPFSSPSLPLIPPLSSFGFFAVFTPLDYLWNSVSRDLGNQTVHGMEHGWMTEQSWQFCLF